MVNVEARSAYTVYSFAVIVLYDVMMLSSRKLKNTFIEAQVSSFY